MLRHRAHPQFVEWSTKTQMSTTNLASNAALELRTVAPLGAAACGRSVPFLT